MDAAERAETADPVSREIHADKEATTEERFETVDAIPPRDAPEAPSAPPRIAKLGHLFDTQEQIGQGAMSRVYSVFDRSLRRRGAMKVLAPELEKDPR